MITQLLATWIPALLIALSGVMKLSGNPKLLEAMTTLGVGRYVRVLGVMELAFATLVVIPATFKLGFLLASCYFAGAIATELSHDDLKVNPFIPIVLPWHRCIIRSGRMAGKTPSFVVPMAATLVDTLPEGGDWLYEAKFDGYRAIVIKDTFAVKILSRKGNDLTGDYPAVVTAVAALPAKQAVLDGEIVAFD